MLENGGRTYRNYSGCGNTLNGNHPIVREMIFHCLRHWVHNYHVDGFRFDLASILSRNRDGELVPNPPVVESIAEDPLLADTKIIAEAWDAAGAYQVGTFGSLRWAEWNGHYRDDLRRFWRGDPNMVGLLATRLAGSSDLYQASGRQPYHSINFITSHDGFTLNDLVSYSEKHNEANGEENRDGDNNNYSYNYGVEGPDRAARPSKRSACGRSRTCMASLLLSQGVPMLLVGRRMPPHAARQQQRLLPGQRNLLVRLAAGRKERRPAAVLRGAGGLSQGRADGAADRFPPRPPRPRELPDVSWFGPSGGQVEWLRRFPQPGVPAGGRAAGESAVAAEPSRADADPRRHRLAALHPSADRAEHPLAAIFEHGRRKPLRHLSHARRPRADKRRGDDGGPLDGRLRCSRRKVAFSRQCCCQGSRERTCLAVGSAEKESYALHGGGLSGDRSAHFVDTAS